MAAHTPAPARPATAVAPPAATARVSNRAGCGRSVRVRFASGMDRVSVVLLSAGVLGLITALAMTSRGV